MAHNESVLKRLLQRIWRARLYPGFRDKVTRMAIDFFVEASVLVGVLGILDFVITWRQEPTAKVIGWSLGIAIALFSAAVIMQAVNEPDPRELTIDSPASNGMEEEIANA